MKSKLLLMLCVISVLGCAAIVGTDTAFIPWKGKDYFEGGGGGAVEKFEGVEFWKAGTPEQPFKVVGLIIQNRGTDEDTVNNFLFGDFNKREIVKLVRNNKGDGVLTLADDRKTTFYPAAGTAASTISLKLAVFRYVKTEK